MEPYWETETELDFTTERDPILNVEIRKNQSSGNIKAMTILPLDDDKSALNDHLLHVKRSSHSCSNSSSNDACGDVDDDDLFTLPLTLEATHFLKRVLAASKTSKVKAPKPMGSQTSSSSSSDSAVTAVGYDPKKFFLIPPRKVTTGEVMKKREMKDFKDALAISAKRCDANNILHWVTASYNDSVRLSISKVRSHDRKEKKRGIQKKSGNWKIYQRSYGRD